MNIYNIIGISTNCGNEKLNDRIKIMMKYYIKEIEKTENDLFELDNLYKEKNKDDLELSCKRRRLRERIIYSKSVYKELEIASVLFEESNNKKLYDLYINENPKASIEDFLKNFDENNDTKSAKRYKESDIIKKENDEQHIKLNNEKLNDVYNFEVPTYLSFNPDQSENYEKNNVKYLMYRTYEEKDIHQFLYPDEKIEISLIGRLDYQTIFGLQDLGFYRYKIKKTKLDGRMNKPYIYNIFSQINIRLMGEDMEYQKYVSKVLLSDINIEIAEKNNGGYIGDVVLDENKNYSVIHQHERLCAAIENKINNDL